MYKKLHWADPDRSINSMRGIAEKMISDAEELNSAWQDPAAGLPWEIIARHLSAAADRAEAELAKRSLWGKPTVK